MSAAPAAPPRLAWRLTVVASLPSTSAFCCERAATGEPAGLAVLARRQTAGRGSRGRFWTSPPGSLALSALLRPDSPASAAGQWALLAGVAMHEGLAGLVPASTVMAGLDPAISEPHGDCRVNPPVPIPPAAPSEPSAPPPGNDGVLGAGGTRSGALTLKWPNDLLLDGRKLGGILVESATGADGRIAWLVLGFGANLAAAPAIAGQLPAAALAECGPAPAPEQAAAAILERLGDWHRVLQQNGFAPVRAAWLARAHPIGSVLRVSWRDGAQRDGRFAGLSEDGGLLLQTADGLRAYSAGDVLLGTGAESQPLVEPPRAPT